MREIEDSKLYIRRANGVENFIDVGRESIFTKPTILCCGGAICTHTLTDKANGFAKKADALLNTLEIHYDLKPFQVAAVTYAQAHTTGESIKAYNSGQTRPDMFKSFVDEQFVPLFLDANGERLPLEQVQRNFRNIQVLAHSFGGIFIQQVGNLLVDSMLEHGFAQAEVDKATQQIVVITSGSAANLHKGKAKFTEFDIFHGNDTEVSKYSQNITIGEILAELRGQDQDALAAIKFKYDTEKRGFILADDASQLVLFANRSSLDEPTLHRLNESRSGVQKKDLVLEEITDAEFHGCTTFYSYSLGHNGMMLRLIAANTLDNALNNSIRNFRKQSSFEPIASVETLVHSSLWQHQKERRFGGPNDSSQYSFDVVEDFSKAARVIGYDLRIDDAIRAAHIFRQPLPDITP